MISDHQFRRVLRHLYRIVDAGEKGYATAAANMPDPALKILLKLYAQQRYNFKQEILAELRRLGSDTHPSVSLPGTIHRGRVAIFAAMASSQPGQAAIVLKEAALGERVALRSYQSALNNELPTPTRVILELQQAEIHKASQQIQCLRDDLRKRKMHSARGGQPERQRSAVRLSCNEHDTAEAVQALMSSGFGPEEIETLRLSDQALYQGHGATLAETALSGAFGGALWGGLMGLLAGFGVVQTMNPAGAAVLAWALTTLAFLLIGALISSVLALFIGLNTSGEDRYLYASIRENAQVLVRARTCVAADI